MLDAGGATPPSKPLKDVIKDANRVAASSDSLPRTTASWLSAYGDEHNLSHLTESIGSEDLTSLCNELAENRVAFLARLKQLGVSKLGDRQKVANCLSRDRRESRLWLPGDPAPPPQKSAAPLLPRPVAAPTLKAASNLQSPERSASMRNASIDIDADPIMAEIKKRRPVSAWQQASVNMPYSVVVQDCVLLLLHAA